MEVTNKTIGQLIDELITTDMRAWFAQDKIMNTALSNDERLFASVEAQKFNIKRNALIRAIDEKFGEKFSVDRKSYE